MTRVESASLGDWREYWEDEDGLHVGCVHHWHDSLIAPGFEYCCRCHIARQVPAGRFSEAEAQRLFTGSYERRFP